jgi:hypothetical protein
MDLGAAVGVSRLEDFGRGVLGRKRTVTAMFLCRGAGPISVASHLGNFLLPRTATIFFVDMNSIRPAWRIYQYCRETPPFLGDCLII